MSDNPKKLFSELGLKWLENYQYADLELKFKVSKLLHELEKNSPQYKRAVWNGIYYKKAILQPCTQDFEVKWVDAKIGFGLFATRSFQKGEGLGAYIGLLRHRSFFSHKDTNPYCFSFSLQPSFFQRIWNGPLTIDALNMGNHTRLINHSQNPNCESVGAIFRENVYIIIRTLRPVEKGAQFFYDYGQSYWSKRSDLADI